MSEEHKARIRDFIERVLNQGDIEATGDCFHVDMVEEVPFPGQGPGLQGLKDFLVYLRTAFPDSVWCAEEQVAEGDKVVTRLSWTATHKGEFLGIPPTNRRIQTWGIVIDRFEGERVKSTRVVLDMLSLLQQLGAVPG